MAAFFGTPLFGAYSSKIGARRIFLGGAIGIAVTTILFGFLDYVTDTETFIVLSYLIR